MTLENKLGLTEAAELARVEEKLSKAKAALLFEQGLLDTLPTGTFAGLAAIHRFFYPAANRKPDAAGQQRRQRSDELFHRRASLFVVQYRGLFVLFRDHVHYRLAAGYPQPDFATTSVFHKPLDAAPVLARSRAARPDQPADVLPDARQF